MYLEVTDIAQQVETTSGDHGDPSANANAPTTQEDLPAANRHSASPAIILDQLHHFTSDDIPSNVQHHLYRGCYEKVPAQWKCFSATFNYFNEYIRDMIEREGDNIEPVPDSFWLLLGGIHAALTSREETSHLRQENEDMRQSVDRLRQRLNEGVELARTGAHALSQLRASFPHVLGLEE